MQTLTCTEHFYRLAHGNATRPQSGKCPFRAVLQTRDLHNTPPQTSVVATKEITPSSETSEEHAQCKCVEQGKRPKGAL